MTRRSARAALVVSALLASAGGCERPSDAAVAAGGAAGKGGPGAAAAAGPNATPSGLAKPAALTTHAAGDGPAPTRPQIDAAIRKGVEYLVASQRKDGSWGSTAPTLTVDIYAPSVAAQQAYQVATSALAVSALFEVGDGVPGAAEALRKGTDFLIAHCRVKRASIDVLYNVWAHAYSLEAFARILAVEKDAARADAMRKAGAACVDMLQKFEYAEGGWGYYDFDSHTANPANMSTSFGTATVLVALRMAKDQGIAVPQPLTDHAVRFLGKVRNPNGSFAYSWDHRYYPQGPINKIKGSLARTPACYEALRDWGGKVSDEQVALAFEHLRKDGRFLAIARKYTYPHETWYQNSGYFTFYGYYYASRLLGVLPPAQRAVEAASIATYLVPLQETDGSWWDYQLYGYHKPYGTAYVLMSLARCR